MDTLKGPGEVQHYNGSSLRIAIIHARWNTPIVSSLVSATRSALLSSGVSPQNIVTESVPGAYELPSACQTIIRASHRTNMTGAGGLHGPMHDPLGGSNAGPPWHAHVHAHAHSEQIAGEKRGEKSAKQQQQPPPPPPVLHTFDAVIAIGVLIKGETMHFEYISEAVSHGLMRVQLHTGVPVIFGLLTVLTEEQGMARAGMNGGHNHGTDWGHAAVEVASKRRMWGEGYFAS